MADSDRVVSVEICGQRYPIRSTLDAEYVSRLAGFVDEKIRPQPLCLVTFDRAKDARLTYVKSHLPPSAKEGGAGGNDRLERAAA